MPRVQEPDAAARRAFSRACRLYNQLAVTLEGIVKRLRAGDMAAAPLGRHELETIRAHQKTVVMVLEFEKKLLQSRIGADGDTVGSIDLGAARAEVARRLARIEADSGADGVS
ncbi:MAG: hypothetical protein ACK4WC_04655 [Rubrimonas sp.]